MLTAAIVLLSVGTMMAQQMPPIPQDPDVKVGKLDNGLTYYLRHNAYPEGVASYYIAQKVGSLQEEESQRGLAHLLEHLAFNGTDHFKDNDLQEYLQSIGVEYGRNLNAYTSIDKTVYYFTDVPTKRATAVDSCLMILKDWSNGITLTEKAINDERDIVHNEYRMRMVGQQRMIERSLPALYPGSKYGVRMPIGLMSVIDGCKPDVLRAYYKKWYRPDNQAIIIVGDIDVNQIEQKIKTLFGDIKVPADAAKVETVQVPDNEQAIYVIDKDKEMQNNAILVFMKHEPVQPEEKSNIGYMIQMYADEVIAHMLNQRFSEKANEPECPFLYASISNGDYFVSKTKGALTLQVVPKPGKDVEAYTAALEEVKRAADHGFLATELVRAREEFLSQEEKAYSNRDKMKNEQFTSQYVDNFEENEPIPSVEQEYMIYKQLVPNIPVEVINQGFKQYVTFGDKNFVTFAMLVEKDGATYPTAEQLASAKAKVAAETLEAYVDNTKQEPLIAQAPKAGKVVKTTENKTLGFKELTLSNGVKVILKKTDFKDDEIQMTSYAKGGYSAFPETQAQEAAMLTQVADASGLGNFSSTDLDKALAGKQVTARYSIGEQERGLTGNSTPKDVETLMQLIYLEMTNVTKDEKNFENLRQQYITILSTMSNNPQLVYQDSLSRTLGCGSEFSRIQTVDDLKALNYDHALQIVRDMYSNAQDFTFIFCGNIDEQTLLPLINTYLASLPNSGKTFKNKNLPEFKGEVKNIFTKAMENPQNQATEYWRSAVAPNTLRNRVTCDIAGRMLDMTYNRNIREKLSAAYHAGAQGDIDLDAADNMRYVINGSAQLNPEKSDEAVPYFFSGMKETIAQPNADDLQKVKEILLKQADVRAKTNNYWLSILARYQKYGLDCYTDYKQTVSATTPQMISDFLQNTILKAGNHAEVIMKAVKTE